MQSESAIENHSQGRGRRRKRGNASEDGPVFVDNSGRRARLLRRFGMLVGAVCFGYAVVLGMAFMGWGTSLTPSSLFPFCRAWYWSNARMMSRTSRWRTTSSGWK